MTAYDDYLRACRDCAFGLLQTAREHKAMNQPREVARLVTNARWYWRKYLQEMIR